MNFQTSAILAILLLPSPPAILAAQAAPLLDAWRPQHLPDALMPSTSIRSQAPHHLAAGGTNAKPTHWREGGIVGAVVLGITVASLGGGLCSYGETGHDCTGATLLGAVAGGGVGFVIGALVGGLFPKRQ